MIDVLTRRLEHQTTTPELNAHVISAFNEAFNNIVEHAYRGEPTGVVAIEITLSSTSLAISFIDRGIGFDVDDVEQPDLESLPERGLGLVIIRSVMSRIDYRRKGDRNILSLEKDFVSPLVMGDEGSSDRCGKEEE